MNLYIATNGNDNWSGTLPSPNSKKTDGPLATFDGVLKKIQAIKTTFNDPDRYNYRKKQIVTEPVTVWVRGGRYELHQPLIFSHQESYPLLFKAYGKEKPIISGGKIIKGWEEFNLKGKRAWRVFIPEVKDGEWEFRSLFVNGKRALKPRVPQKGFLTMQNVPDLKQVNGGWDKGGQKTFIYYKNDLPQTLEYPEEIEVIFMHLWIEERSKVVALDHIKRQITLERPSMFKIQGDEQINSIGLKDNPTYYYFENVFEALTNEGEWFLNKKDGELIYIPRKNEKLENTEVIAPSLLQLVAFLGEPEKEKYVEFIGFEGLTFAHTDWRHPDYDGALVLGSSNPHHIFCNTYSRRMRRKNSASVQQAACDVPGVITFEGARNCKIENCHIQNVGWYAIEIGDGSSNIKISGNIIKDIGAGGVKINGMAARDQMPSRETGSSHITDNLITECGRIFYSAAGVLSMNARKMVIAHNEISDLYYTGISCGWEWGYGSNISCDNLIEQNLIYNLGQKFLSDMGGIYILGVQPGTVVRRNVVFNVKCAKYGGWCIYLDEGSSHVIVEENLAYDADREIFHQHYGRENTLRNNIFAFGETAVIRCSRTEEHVSLVLYNNIFISNGKPIIGKGYDKDIPRILGMNNIVYDLKNKIPYIETPTNPHMSWKEWQKLGKEVSSAIANPLLILKGKKEFTLKNKSLLEKLAIQLPDFSNVGIRPVNKRR